MKTVILMLLLVGAVQSQDMDGLLRVGVVEMAPFVMHENERVCGFEHDLFEQIALLNDWEYQYLKKDYLLELLDSIGNGDVDIGIGGITATSDREVTVDFSLPTMDAPLSLIFDNSHISFSYTDALLNERSVVIYLYSFIFLLLSAHIIYFSEKGREDGFSDSYFIGLGQAFYFTWITISTVGYGDFSCKTKVGRLFSMSIIGVGAVIFGMIVTELNIAINNNSDDISIDIIKEMKVAVKAGTVSEEYAMARGAKVASFHNIDQAYSAFSDGIVDGVLNDKPANDYHIKQNQHVNFASVSEDVSMFQYSFGLPSGSEMREDLNVAILRLKESGKFQELHNKWFK